MYALDAQTGKLAYENRIVDYREDSAQETSGPSSPTAKSFPAAAASLKPRPTDVSSRRTTPRRGQELWRTAHHSEARRTRRRNLGQRSRQPAASRWHLDGSQLRSRAKLIYIGTSVTSPAPKFWLAGNDKKYLYHNCTLALSLDTGKIVWYYQHVVDHWDFDHPFERLLIDTKVPPDPAQVSWINPRLKPGELRKVVTGIPGKTGIVYTLDRQDRRISVGRLPPFARTW